MAGEVAAVQTAQTKKVDLNSNEEFDRYRGPVLIENTKTGQTKIYEKDDTKLFHKVSPEETVFYPGLTLRDTNAQSRGTFALMDVDKDTVLSEQEFKDAVSAKMKVDEAKEKIIKPKDEKLSLLSKMGLLSCVASLIPIFVAAWRGHTRTILGSLLSYGGLIALGVEFLPKFIQVVKNDNVKNELNKTYKDNEYAQHLIKKEV